MSAISDVKIAALQPYVLLAKNVKDRAAVELIGEAIQAPGCYVFSELLQCPNIVALQTSPQHSNYHTLLQIFAYGSYSDYKVEIHNLPKLNAKQMQKLKQLSLVTIASWGNHKLSYESLLVELELPTVRALEDLIISAIYEEIVEAKLDTKSQLVEVVSTMGRDVAASEISSMVCTLNEWYTQCESVLFDVDEQMKQIQQHSLEKKKDLEEYEKLVQQLKDQLKDDKSSFGGKGKRVISDGVDDTRGYEDEMDLDEHSFGIDGQGGLWGGANTSRRRTKGRFTNLMPGNKRR